MKLSFRLKHTLCVFLILYSRECLFYVHLCSLTLTLKVSAGKFSVLLFEYFKCFIPFFSLSNCVIFTLNLQCGLFYNKKQQ